MARRRILPIWTGCLLALCAFSGAAQTPEFTRADPNRADLVGVYLRALDHNPRYQAALADYRAILELKPQATGRLLPRLGLQAEYKVVRQAVEGDFFGFTDIDRSETFDRLAFSVALSQTVFRRDAFLGLERAEVEIGRARLLLTDARHQLMVGAAEAYFGLLAAIDNARFATAQQEAVVRQLDQTIGRFESGIVSEADLKAVQAQVDITAADEIAARNQIEIARTRLELITGTLYENIARLPDEARLPMLDPEALEPWLERAQQHNIALLAQMVGARIAELDIDIARSQHLPTLDIIGSHVYFDADGGISGARKDEDSRIGLVVNMPIFSGGITESRVRQARARGDREMLMIENERAQARFDTRSAYLDAQTAKARVDALSQAVVSARAAEDSAQVSFDVGSRTAADYLSTVRERYRAERDLSLARYNYLLSMLKLRKAAGVLTVADIDLVNLRLQR
jgi:outer membrane protein